MKNKKKNLMLIMIFFFTITLLNAYVWRPDDSLTQLQYGDGTYIGGSSLNFMFINTSDNPPAKALAINGSSVEYISGDPDTWHPTEGNWIGVKVTWPFTDSAYANELGVGSIIKYNENNNGWKTKTLTANELSNHAFYFYFDAANYLRMRTVSFDLDIDWLNDGTRNSDDESITIALQNLNLDLGSAKTLVRDASVPIAQDTAQTGGTAIDVNPTYHGNNQTDLINDNDTDDDSNNDGTVTWYFDGQAPITGDGNWIGLKINNPYQDDGVTQFTFNSGDEIGIYYNEENSNKYSHIVSAAEASGNYIDVYFNSRNTITDIYIDWDLRYDKEHITLDNTALVFEVPTINNITINSIPTGDSNTYKVGDTISGTVDITGTNLLTMDFSGFGGDNNTQITSYQGNASDSPRVYQFSYTLTAGSIDALTSNLGFTADNTQTTVTSSSGNYSVDNELPDVTNWGNFTITNDDTNNNDFADINNGNPDDVSFSSITESTNDGIKWIINTNGNFPNDFYYNDPADNVLSQTIQEGNLNSLVGQANTWNPTITVKDNAGNEVTGNAATIIKADNVIPLSNYALADAHFVINPRSSKTRDYTLDVGDVIRVSMNVTNQGIADGIFDFSAINASQNAVHGTISGNTIYADYTIQYGDNQVNNLSVPVVLYDSAENTNNNPITISKTADNQNVNVNPTPQVVVDYYKNVDANSQVDNYLKSGQDSQLKFTVYDESSVNKVRIDLNTDANGIAGNFSVEITNGFGRGVNYYDLDNVNTSNTVVNGDNITATTTIFYDNNGSPVTEQEVKSIVADENPPTISDIKINNVATSDLDEGTNNTLTAKIEDAESGVNQSSITLNCSDANLIASSVLSYNSTTHIATWTNVQIPADYDTDSITLTITADDNVSNSATSVNNYDIKPVPTIASVYLENMTSGIDDYIKDGDQVRATITLTDQERIDDLSISFTSDNVTKTFTAPFTSPITYTFNANLGTLTSTLKATVSGSTNYTSGVVNYSASDEIGIDITKPVITDITHSSRTDVDEGVTNIKANITETGSKFNLTDLKLTVGTTVYQPADSYDTVNGIATWNNVSIPDNQLNVDLKVDATDRVGNVADQYSEVWEIGPVPTISSVSIENLSVPTNSFVKTGDDLKITATLTNYERIDQIKFSFDEIADEFVINGPFTSSTINHTFSSVDISAVVGNLTAKVTGTTNYATPVTYSNSSTIVVDTTNPTISNMRTDPNQSTLDENTVYTFKADILDNGSGVNNDLSTMVLKCNDLGINQTADSYDGTSAVWNAVSLPNDIDLSQETFAVDAQDIVGNNSELTKDWNITPTPTISSVALENVNYPTYNYLKNGDDLKVTINVTDPERIDELKISLDSDGTQSYTFAAAEIAATMSHTFTNVNETADNTITALVQGTTNYATPVTYSNSSAINVDNELPSISNLNYSPADAYLVEGHTYSISANVSDAISGLNNSSITLSCNELSITNRPYDSFAGGVVTWNNITIDNNPSYSEINVVVNANDNIDNTNNESTFWQVGNIPTIASIQIENTSQTTNDYMKDGDNLKVVTVLNDYQKIDELDVKLGDGSVYSTHYTKAQITGNTIETVFNNVSSANSPLVATSKITTYYNSGNEVDQKTDDIIVDNDAPQISNIIYLSRQSLFEGNTYSIQANVSDAGGSGLIASSILLNCNELSLSNVPANTFVGGIATWNNVLTIPTTMPSDYVTVNIVANDNVQNQGSTDKIWDIGPVPTISNVTLENITDLNSNYMNSGDNIQVTVTLTDFERIDNLTISLDSDNTPSKSFVKADIISNQVIWVFNSVMETSATGIITATVNGQTNHFNGTNNYSNTGTIGIDNALPVVSNIRYSNGRSGDFEEGQVYNVIADLSDTESGINTNLNNILLNCPELNLVDVPATSFDGSSATWNDVLNIPNPFANNNINVTISAKDNVMNSGSNLVTWTINHTPTFTSTPVTNATQDVAYTYNVTTNDIDGDALTITASTLPTWLSLTDNNDGTATLTGTPTNSEVGNHNVVLTVNDGTATTDQSFTITVSNTNDAPTFTSTPVTNATQDVAYTYNVTTNDIDGDALTITASLPIWLSFTDNNDGTATLTGTPTNSEVGNHNVVLTVNDGTATTNQNFTITVQNVNDAPTFTSTPVTNATQDIAYTYNVTTNDIDGDALIITASTRPIWLSLTDNNDGTATLTGTPTNSEVGNHNVVLTVNDGTATTDQSFTITVSNTNDAPTFTSTPVTNATQDVAYTYNVTTNDIDNDALTITASILPTWLSLTDNNDGTATLTGTPTNSEVGNHNVVLTVNDGTATTNQNFTITVQNVNDAPTFTSTPVTNATQDVAYTYNVTTNDIDGDALIITASTLPTWLSFTDNNDGTATLTGTPTNSEVGNHNVVLTVNDGTATTDQSFTITVSNTNDAPTFTSTPVTNATQDVVYTYNVTTNDIDGDALTITASTLPTWLSLTDNNDGTATLTGTPTNSEVGNHNVVLTVNDGTTTTDQSFTITVSNVNDAPTFTSTPVTTATQDVAYTYNVTTNDVDGDALTITASTLPTWLSLTDNNDGTATLTGTPTNSEVGNHNVVLTVNDGTTTTDQSFTITVSNVNDAPTFTSTPVTNATQDVAYTYNVTTNDIDGDALTITASLPTWLSLTDNNDGTATLTGTPTNSEVGNHNVVLTVNDGTATTDQSFTITVSNTNDAPTFTSTPVTTATQDVAYTYNVTTNDIDGDALTITASTLPTWLSLTDNNDGTATLTGTPTNSEVGNHNVVLTVNDGTTTTDQSFTITVSNTNDAPTFTSTPVTNATQDVAYTYNVTTNDIDGDALTITASTLPTWLSLTDNNDGTATLTGTPTNSEVGNHNVVLTVNDGTATTDQSFTITVSNVNDAPTFTSTPVTNATQDVAYTYNVTTNDIDGDALIITASTLPTWLSLTDNNDGTATLTGTPTNSEVGNHNVVLTVNDGTTTTDQSFTITVSNVNDAPTFTSTPVTDAMEGLLYTYNITANDIDNDALTITASLPTWLSLTDNGDGTAVLSGTPSLADSGINSIVVSVDDSDYQINQVFAIEVKSAPIINSVVIHNDNDNITNYMNNQDDLTINFSIDNPENLDQLTVSLDSEDSPSFTFTAPFTNTMSHTFTNVAATANTGTITASVNGQTTIEGVIGNYSSTGTIAIDNVLPVISNISFSAMRASDLLEGMTYTITADISDADSGVDANSILLNCTELSLTDIPASNYDGTTATWNNVLVIPTPFNPDNLTVTISAKDVVQNEENNSATWTVGAQPSIGDITVTNSTENNPTYMNNGDDLTIDFSLVNPEEIASLIVSLDSDDAQTYTFTSTEIAANVSHTFNNVVEADPNGTITAIVSATSVSGGVTNNYSNTGTIAIDNVLPVISNISFSAMRASDLLEGMTYTITADISDADSGVDANSILLNCTELSLTDIPASNYNGTTATWNNVLVIPTPFNPDNLTVTISAKDVVQNEGNNSATWTVGAQPSIGDITVTNSTENITTYMNNGDDLTIDFSLVNPEEIASLSVSLDSDDTQTYTFTSTEIAANVSHTFNNVVEADPNGTITAIVSATSVSGGVTNNYSNTGTIAIDNVLPVISNIAYSAMRASDLLEGMTYTITADISDADSGVDANSILLNCTELSLTDIPASNYDGTTATWNNVLVIPTPFNPDNLTVTISAKDVVQNEGNNSATWTVGAQPSIGDITITNSTEDITTFMNNGDDLTIDFSLVNPEEIASLIVSLDSDDAQTYTFTSTEIAANVSHTFNNVVEADPNGTITAIVSATSVSGGVTNNYSNTGTIAIDNVLPVISNISFSAMRASDLLEGMTYTITADISDADSGVDANSILLNCTELSLTDIPASNYDGTTATWNNVLVIPTPFNPDNLTVTISAKDVVQNEGNNSATWTVGAQPSIGDITITNSTEDITTFMHNGDNLTIDFSLVNPEEIASLSVSLDSDDAQTYTFTSTEIAANVSHTFNNVVEADPNGTITAIVSATSVSGGVTNNYSNTGTIAIDNLLPEITETGYSISDDVISLQVKIVDAGIGIDKDSIWVDLSEFTGSTKRVADSYDNEYAIWNLSWQNDLNSQPVDGNLTIYSKDKFGNGPATLGISIQDTPTITISTNELAFASTYFGHNSDSQSVVLNNISYNTLIINSISLPSGFEVQLENTDTWTGNITEFEIAPRTSKNIEIRYSPIQNVQYSGNATITTNDPNNASVLISLSTGNEGTPTTFLKPNIFTPNGDGINDDYRIGPFTLDGNKTAEFKVYNLKGRPVLSLSSPANQEIVWNGKKDTNHKLAEGNIYFYRYLINGKLYRSGKIYIIK